MPLNFIFFLLAATLCFAHPDQVQWRNNNLDNVLNETIKIEKRSVPKDRRFIWRTKIVPFTLKNLEDDDIDVILQAMQTIADASCVNFKERKSEQNWVEFSADKKGTITAVGKQTSRKNEQKVVFQEKDFQEIGNVLREIMNVLGFYNEYNRPDRNLIVNVYMDNLRVDLPTEMDRLERDVSDELGLKYDLDSVTQYNSERLASAKGLHVITPRLEDYLRPGGEGDLSSNDVVALNRYYDCKNSVKGGWSSWFSGQCFMKGKTCVKNAQRYCTVDDLKKCPNADKDGLEIKDEECDKSLCNVPVAGEWGTWTVWDKCPAAAGAIKIVKRRRLCDSPPPKNGGKECSGKSEERKTCRNDPPIKGINDCTFEFNNCFWRDESANPRFMFRRYKTERRRKKTGPLADHTKKTPKGFYMIAQSGFPAEKGDIAVLRSPFQNPTTGTGVCLKFWFHMYGSQQGTLEVVMVRRTKEMESVKEIPSNDYGDNWIPEETCLENSKVFAVEFHAKRSASDVSDIAIDDVYFERGSCCDDGIIVKRGKAKDKKGWKRKLGYSAKRGGVTPKPVARGCFRDLEGTMKPFPYYTELPQRKGLDIVAECVRLVQDLLYSVKIIGVKENECWYGPVEEINVEMYGKSTECKTNELKKQIGGKDSVFVYDLK